MRGDGIVTGLLYCVLLRIQVSLSQPTPSPTSPSGFNCPVNYTKYGGSVNKCVRFVLTLHSRDEGQTVCGVDGALLASIMSDDEMLFIKQNIPTYAGHYYWFGLTDRQEEGKFVWPGGEFPVNTWWGTENNNQPDGDGACTAARSTSNAEWYDRPCAEANRLICEWKRPVRPAIKCPPKYKQYANEAKCLRVINTMYTRDEGQSVCEGDGGQLASMKGPEEMTFINRSIVFLISFDNRQPRDGYWIGLNDRETEGLFVWADGSPVKHSYWKMGTDPQPNMDGDCVVTRPSKNLNWFDRNCTFTFGVICETMPINITANDTTIGTSTSAMIESVPSTGVTLMTSPASTSRHSSIKPPTSPVYNSTATSRESLTKPPTSSIDTDESVIASNNMNATSTEHITKSMEKDTTVDDQDIVTKSTQGETVSDSIALLINNKSNVTNAMTTREISTFQNTPTGASTVANTVKYAYENPARIKKFIPTTSEAPGAALMGTISFVIISILLACIVLSDLTTIRSNARYMMKNIGVGNQ